MKRPHAEKRRKTRKNAEKRRFLTIFDFANVHQKVSNVQKCEIKSGAC